MISNKIFYSSTTYMMFILFVFIQSLVALICMLGSHICIYTYNIKFVIMS